jgi:hypothetical protein
MSSGGRARSIIPNFNLQAFAELATLALLGGVDLFAYRSADTGAGIRNALDSLAPYMSGARTWPRREIGAVDQFAENGQTLARAAVAYPDGPYQTLLDQLSQDPSPLDLLRLRLGFWPD